MRHAPRRFLLSALALSLVLVEAPAGRALAAVEDGTAPAADPPCGPAWSLTTTKNVSDTNNLYGIDGVATNDVWAVGDSSENEITTTLGRLTRAELYAARDASGLGRWEFFERTVSGPPEPDLR